MVGVRRVAAIVSLIDGAWGILAGVYWRQVFGINAPMAGGEFWIVVVGVVLLLDSVVCLVGLGSAYYASAALSILLMIDFLLSGAPIGSPGFVLSALLGLITVVLDAIAVR